MKNILTLILFSFLLNLNAQEKTNLLIGTELTYKYEKGNHYHVKIEKEGLSYRFLNGSKPDKWWGPFEHKTLVKENGNFMLAWYERGYGDYVTLDIDFDENILYGSALIIKKTAFTHLQKAVIEETNFRK